jgi:pimeloyl-ACP methyl ester carboxylesterase
MMLVEPNTDTSITLNDGRVLAYAEYGDPNGQPIILFHGTPGSRLSGALFDSVGREHSGRILAADRPGYARSSPIRNGTLLVYVNDVVALADTLHLDKFAVLGVSGGAPYALACASTIPERVTCCALMSAIGPLGMPHSLDGMVTVNRIVFSIARLSPDLVGALLPGQVKASMKSIQKLIDEGKSPMPDISPTIFAQLMADQFEAVRAGGKGIAFDMRNMTHDWDFPLEAITTKVYMWHGEEDNLAPVALARYLAEHIPGCSIHYVAGAGHAGTFACAGEVMEALVC